MTRSLMGLNSEWMNQSYLELLIQNEIKMNLDIYKKYISYVVIIKSVFIF